MAGRFTWGDDNGPFVRIYDSDFGFDAAFKISGDWSNTEKLNYAQAVCRVLNFHDAVIPTRSTSDASGDAPK